MVALVKPPELSPPMTAETFYALNPGGAEPYQLVDGEPQAMSPASPDHGALQGELGRVIGNALRAAGSRCRLVVAPGVMPRLDATHNIRIPDLAVTCTDPAIEGAWLTSPVLVAEILSPSNRRETWINVWAYTTIPSLQEILVLGSEDVWAKVLRRAPDGTWPHDPETVADGDLVLDSIGLHTDLADLYRDTGLRRPA